MFLKLRDARCPCPYWLCNTTKLVKQLSVKQGPINLIQGIPAQARRSHNSFGPYFWNRNDWLNSCNCKFLPNSPFRVQLLVYHIYQFINVYFPFLLKNLLFLCVSQLLFKSNSGNSVATSPSLARARLSPARARGLAGPQGATKHREARNT